MKPADELIWEEKCLFSYEDAFTGPPLPEWCRRLFEEQIAAWEALQHAHNTLITAKRREVACNSPFPPWTIQFNPGRATSAEAKIDVASIASRPCFLCPAQLPPDQKMILYRHAFGILCNPFPIFSPHFTVASLRHQPQNLEGHLPVLLRLAQDLAPDFSVFYNGPRCGASAPDHLHFQAYPAGAIPIERASLSETGMLVKTIGSTSILDCRRSGRMLFFLTGSVREDLVTAASVILQALKEMTGENEEAMVNVIAAFVSGRWRLFVFPRRKHRPDAFFRRGEDRRAITPGAVEMGGLVVTTNERDYMKLDSMELMDIFTEVSIDHQTMDSVVDALRADHG